MSEAVAVGVAEGLSAGRRTPLFQINLMPDLLAVYFFPPQIIIYPSRVGLRVGPTTPLVTGNWD